MKIITTYFPLWAILLSICAYYSPELFAAGKPAIVPLLGLVMFGMGITLTFDNFTPVFKQPLLIVTGLLLQFILMPLIAFGIATAFSLPTEIAIGLILVGCCPGGTASNVICYLAKGNVALSITLTAFSTILAVLVTPWLTLFYAGQMAPVPFWSMVISIFKIILVPVVLGILVNRYFGKHLKPLQEFFPAVSVMSIVVIIAIIIGLNHGNLEGSAMIFLVAVMLHNLLGLFFGYTIPKLMKFNERDCRTIAIEVGMQNSGLGVALALKYFSAAAALPGAIFSIWHNLSGSMLASYWSRKSDDEREVEKVTS